MAEKGDNIFSVAVQLISNFLETYSIWLWLSVWGLSLLLLDHNSIISLNAVSTNMHTAAVVGTVFFICMLMNALTAHVYAWQVIASLAYAIFEISKEIFVFIPRRRVFIKNARKEFERIISIDCKERYWILWFIFKFRIDHRLSYNVRVIKNTPTVQFDDWYVSSLLMRGILVPWSYKLRDDFIMDKSWLWKNTEQKFPIGKILELDEAFSFLEELRLHVGRNPHLANDLKKLRAKIIETDWKDLEESEIKHSPTFYRASKESEEYKMKYEDPPLL